MAGVRECGCPEWVLRCAHWDGQILVFAQNGEHDLRTCEDYLSNNYFVKLGQCYRTMLCGNPQHRCLSAKNEPTHVQLSWPEAEAEFARREAQMLGREP